MNCERVQTLLSALLDNELGAEDARIVRNHCNDCPGCYHELTAVKALKSNLGALRTVEPPAHSFHTVKESVFGARRTKARWVGRAAMVVATACAALLFLWVSRPQPTQGQSPQLAAESDEIGAQDYVYSNGMGGAYQPASLARQGD